MNQPKITLLHYSEISRLLYSRLLSQAGFDVAPHPTNTPEEVISVLMQERPNLAVISVAFGSPTQESSKRRMGLDTLVQIRQAPELSTLPVIMESSSDEYGREALAKGANAYVGGANPNKVLIEKVRVLLGQ